MSKTSATIVFMGSPDFAVPSLDALVGSERYRPSLVVSQPDRPRGRGQTTSPTPVRRRAIEHGLATLVMSKENYAEVVGEIAVLKPDVIVVVAFGIIVKTDLLSMPRLGCINVHASLLPDYRGVSPIQAAILAGEPVTGCSTMVMDEGVDTGDLLLEEETEILPGDTAGILSERLSRLGAHLLVTTLDGLFDGSITPMPQPEATGPYTRKIKKKHGAIDWSRDADAVERQIRAMTPWPSAFGHLGGKRVIVVEASVPPEPSVSAQPGTIVSTSPLRVACGSGAVDIQRIKPEGKQTMPARDYLSGHAIRPGDRFE